MGNSCFNPKLKNENKALIDTSSRGHVSIAKSKHILASMPHNQTLPNQDMEQRWSGKKPFSPTHSHNAKLFQNKSDDKKKKK